MTTFSEPTGEGWVRSVNKRLAQLERLPRGVNGTISAAELTGQADTNTSTKFEADVLLTTGGVPDVSAVMDGVVYAQDAEDPEALDPYMREDYEDQPTEILTELTFATATPTDPFVEQRTGGVAVIWDGRCAGGESIPVNVLMVEVHRSMEEFFEPDESTYCGSFLDAGVIVFSDQEYEVQWWYRLVMLTIDGSRSTPSNPVEGTAHKITQFEVGFSALDIDYDGAINSAYYAAINAAARTNYSTNPSLLNHTGPVLAEWVGMEWIEDQFTSVVDGGGAGTSLYPDTIDGGSASTATWDATLDGGSA